MDDVVIANLPIRVYAPIDRRDDANQKTVDRLVQQARDGRLRLDRLLTKSELKRGLRVEVGVDANSPWTEGNHA